MSLTSGGPPIKRTPVTVYLALIIIIAAAALLRLSYNANTVIVEPIRADAANYLIYANNLLDHATFSKDRASPPVADSYWAPGYPTFLATIIQAAKILRTSQSRFAKMEHAEI